MEGSAVDYCVLEDIVEKVGVQEFRKMAKEVAPPALDLRRVACHSLFVVSAFFWLAITPSLFLVEIPEVLGYPIAIGNLVLVQRVFL